ncbi:hypothetical protein [Pseudomonas siliginis]|uniref:Uncharacterized protein n=1 Tax=Pseudomonas siliginis TaxID=2842346 RepID=A0ABY5CGZ0_9PSED|nr:hypothetical protein [Pseudomonas siliginis]UST75925.1 hypothetical protein NF675_07495 [Pseudomonas siliginis]UST86535.1 hypothetical protein NF677_07595 [Pseudomonas siliginis]UST91739.1 hypothetical protein NF678_07375 [Pseudomonas siliginis]UVL95950.1 hypothetical protein LOY48_07495 [Pseudomonas siliginis]
MKIMAERIYKKLQGMTLDYVSGQLEENPKERSIRYTVSFDLDLDFTHFVQMANLYIPDYLNNPVNAIRPELDGLAYHYSYNYLFDSAGNVRDKMALFTLFTSPGYYMDQWATGVELAVRYGKPAFEVVGQKLRITASRDFRLVDESRTIKIADLPLLQFHWALNLLQSDLTAPDITVPVTKVVLMYMHEDFVQVEGQWVLRGVKYVDRNQLRFGTITAKQMLTAM